MRDTGLANRIRAKGVRVIEVAGWQTRGRSDFVGRGSINHHTAGSSRGTAPSLNICINGRSDLPGPLANVVQSREGGDGLSDIAYVIAAGKANHGGTGYWRHLSGNAQMYGLEMEHTGYGTVPPGRLEVSARIHAAFLEGPNGLRDAAFTCQHFEYARPLGRKPDFRELAPFTADSFRSRVAYWIGRTAGSPAPTPVPVPAPAPTLRRDGVHQLIKGDKSATIFVTDGLRKRRLWSPDHVGILRMQYKGAHDRTGSPDLDTNGGHAFVLPQAYVDTIPDT